MPGVSAILTAAGESTRMGRPKPLLPWLGVTLVEYQVRSLIEGGASEVIVVLGHAAGDVSPYVKGTGVRAVLNPDYLRGRTTSIKAGLAAVDPSVEAIVLLAVDQPRTPAIVSRMISTHLDKDALITAPRYGGRGGHPIVFASSLRGELEAISEETEGIRAVFRKHQDEVNEVQVDDLMVQLDLNTFDDYERARETYGA